MTFLSGTIVVSGPKRSGTTLLNRLFDSHPGIIDLVDEGFFWEHVYNYTERGHETLFIEMFREFAPRELYEGMLDRAVLPWIDGTYRQEAVACQVEVELGVKTEVFLHELERLKTCYSIEAIWNCVVQAYASASSRDYSQCHVAFIKGADYGKSILAAMSALQSCKAIFIIRHPIFAIDSLKKSRILRKSKLLHPFNLSEVIEDYLFFWEHRSAILNENTMLVKFEELLAQPEPTMRAVAKHLGVKYTDNLINPTLCSGSWPGLSSFKKTRGMDASVLERSAEVLTDLEKKFIRKHAKDIFDCFDYE